MKRSAATLFSIFLLSINTFAQTPGFLGRRFTLFAGTSIAAPVLNEVYAAGPIHTRFDWSMLPPPLIVDLDIALGEHFVVSLFSRYSALQNSQFTYYYEEEYCVGCYTENFKLSTNALSLGLNFKAGFSDAPIGSYFLFGAGASLAGTKIYPTIHTVVKDDSFATLYETDTGYPEGYYKTTVPYFNLGGGKNWILSRRLQMDFGVRNTFFFTNRQHGFNENGTTPGSSETISNSTDYLVGRNLQSTYALEVYLKLGFGF